MDQRFNNILVAFDLDDTLFKERDFLNSGLRYVARRVAGRLRIPYEAAYEAMFNTTLGENYFDRLHNYIDGKVSIQRMVKLYRDHVPMLLLPDDTRDCLAKLQNNGFKMAIITDGRHISQMNKILALGLTKFFDQSLISISEDVGAEKTSLIPWTRMEELAAGCSQRWYIGDNPAKDFALPRARGWHTVMLKDDGSNIHSQSGTWNPDAVAHYEISSLKELPQIILDHACN